MIPGLNILKKIFKTSNERKLNEIQPIVQKINSLEQEIQNLSDQELKNKSQEFKTRIKNGENLNKILPEAFAFDRALKKIQPEEKTEPVDVVEQTRDGILRFD